ncbi:LPD7 domain-containing protein [Pectobacterium parvum]|uniref:LPD7 domain-containing protein n=1 Tax=Pectobacterium parvum TaxID=2778550 RepID=UPI000DC64858|nr:LPD7 domain-containing protein [Pectobacterium parvum]
MSTAEYPVWLAIMPDRRKEAHTDAGMHPDGRSAIEWSKADQLWFARPGADLSRLQAWLPDSSIRSSSGGDPQTEFLNALTSEGLILDGLPVMDGKRHRVPVVDGKKGNLDGVYRGYLDGIRPAGWYINYHRADTDKDITRWKASVNRGDADPVARLHIRAVMRQSKDNFARAQAALYTQQTAKAKALYNRLPAADSEHAYLTRKGITVAKDVRQTRNGALVVPFYNVNGEFQTLQYIPPDGEKYLYKDAPKSGHFRVEGGGLRNGEPILYAEGYATARSLFMVTSRPVVMTIDAGNMQAVAEILKRNYPDSPHLFMADFDHAKGRNKGALSAERSAAATGGIVILPDLTAAEIERGFTDFNDLHLYRGDDRLRDALLNEIAQALEQLNYKDVFMSTPDDTKPTPEATSPRRSGSAKEKTANILKLRDEGLKPAQIAEQLGIGQTSVYRILRAQQPEAEAPSAPAAQAEQSTPRVLIADETTIGEPASILTTVQDSPAVVTELPALDIHTETAPSAPGLKAVTVPDSSVLPEIQPEPEGQDASKSAADTNKVLFRDPPVIQGELRGALVALIRGTVTPTEFQETTERLQSELNHARVSGMFNDAYVSETQNVFDRLTGNGLAVSERPGVFSRALSAVGLKDSDTALSLRRGGFGDVRTVPGQLESLYTRLADGELTRSQFEKSLSDLRSEVRRAELSGQQSPAAVQAAWAAFGRTEMVAGQTEGRAVAAALTALESSPVAASTTEIVTPYSDPKNNTSQVSVEGFQLAKLADTTAPRMPESSASGHIPQETAVPEVKVADSLAAVPHESTRTSPAALADIAVSTVPEPTNLTSKVTDSSAVKTADLPDFANTSPAALASSAIPPVVDFSEDFKEINDRFRSLKGESDSLDTDTLAMRLGGLINERIGLTEMWRQGNDPESENWPSDESEVLEAELRAVLERRPDNAAASLAATFGEENAILVEAPRVAPSAEDVPLTSKNPNIDADKLLSRITYEKQADGKSVLYSLDGEPAFIDRGNRLVMAEGSSSHEEKVLAALLTAANHYHGRIELTGSDEFKAFAIGVIVANKLDVSMKNANQQADLDAARRAAGQPVKPNDTVRGDPQTPHASTVPHSTPIEWANSAPNSANPVMQSPNKEAEPAAATSEVPKILPAVHAPAEKAQDPITGKVTACGQAPFRFEPEANESTFITLRTKEGPQTFWGKELAGLLRETNLKPGRMVTLQWMGEQPVTVKVPQKDEKGIVKYYKNVDTHRNQWSLTPVGGTRVQTGGDEMVPLSAFDANRYTQIQYAVISRLGLDMPEPPRPDDGLYWFKQNGQGSSTPGDALSAPRPPHNEHAGTAVMSAWGDDGKPDLYLVQGDGHYLQGVVRQNGAYHHVLVSLPESKEAPPMVVNLLTPDGAQPIGSGNGINRSNGQPVVREHVVVRLTGDNQPRIAKLDAPSEMPAVLHALLGYDERYKAETNFPKVQPAAAPQVAPVNPPRPA